MDFACKIKLNLTFIWIGLSYKHKIIKSQKLFKSKEFKEAKENFILNKLAGYLKYGN